MPALNFKARFASRVESGEKRQTIRPERKYPIREGARLLFYTGMRTKGCRKLGEAVCTEVRFIRITANGVKLDGVVIAPKQIASLAEADGFADVWSFRDFFAEQYGLPFVGQVIKW